MSKKSSVFSSVLVVIGCMALATTNFSCNPASGSYTLDHRWMGNTATLRWEQDSSVLVIANNASLPTLPVRLSEGKYLLRFKANGTIAAGVLPHLVIRFA